MREKLLKLLEKKQEERKAKMKLVDESNDVEELRKLQKEIEDINKEIRDIQAMIDELPEEEGEGETNLRTAAVNGEIPGAVVSSAKGQEQRKSADEEEMEYRKAFQQFVTRGTPIPAELRDNAVTATAVTATSDLTTAIPTVLVNRIIEKLDSFGMILPLVTKTTFPAGMAIPTSSVKPEATWVAEGAGSDKQKKEVKTSITFTHYKLRCEIAMTMEASVMALSAFEETFVRQVSEAMVKAIEDAIINGAWNTTRTALVGPKGILDETPATGQKVEIGASAKIDYKTLVDAEAALPLAYENGAVWFMTKKTFMEFIGMVDDNKQPIARINYGIDGKPERTLLGRPVILNEYMANYASTVGADTVVAFLFNPRDYVLNTNYNMGIQRKQDWDTEDLLTKAVMAVDGKVIDKNSLVTVVKKAAASS